MCMYSMSIFAQEAAIAKPIMALFQAMEKGDSTGLANLFHPNASLNTVTEKDGQISVRQTPISRFLEGVASAEAGVLLEELHYTEIRQDGDMATAWTPYSFVYKGKISHCGANAFQLARSGEDGAWQIFQIIDSRRRTDCSRRLISTPVERIEKLADDWHQAAAEANAEGYFSLMAEDAIFIGTDATEHWKKAAFMVFAKPYFDEGKAWDFKKKERHVFFNESQDIAYWDELLDTWMGVCRGTGIAQRQADGTYLIKHYTLSVTVPNEKIQGFIDLVQGER